MGFWLNDEFRKSSHTTPDPNILFSLLDEAREKGVEYCLMEVSSHAISQSKVAPINYESVVFTSFSRDHLDYHSSMEEYFDVKWSFISEEIAKGAQAFVSEGVKSFIDKYAKQTSNEYFVYKDGSNKYCDFHISKMNIDGTDFSLVAKYDSYHASVNYMGSYAIENFIAAMLSVETVLASKLADSLDYRRVRAVPGRLDRVESDKGIHVFVDYAHTPDALSKNL